VRLGLRFLTWCPFSPAGVFICQIDLHILGLILVHWLGGTSQMSPMSGPQNCPQCGVSTLSARLFGGRSFCGGCRQELIFCRLCGAANLAWSAFCHSCGKPVRRREERELGDVSRKPSVTPEPESSVPEELRLVEWPDELLQVSPLKPLKELAQDLTTFLASKPETPSKPLIERMRLCASCKKAIGEGEPFCSYCGARQAIVQPGPQALLDPHTMKVAVTMLARITEAKDHPEYSVIDELTTKEIAEVALGKEKPHDAHELSFSDQLKLLALVFEYARDYVGYKGEAFGEHIRWPWETVNAGGDCDCKVVLLATMLASLDFRRMHLLVLPPGKYFDTKGGAERTMQGHVMLEVELFEGARLIRVNLDPSCPDCDVDEIPETVRPFLQNFYRVPIVP